MWSPAPLIAELIWNRPYIIFIPQQYVCWLLIIPEVILILVAGQVYHRKLENKKRQSALCCNHRCLSFWLSFTQDNIYLLSVYIKWTWSQAWPKYDFLMTRNNFLNSHALILLKLYLWRLISTCCDFAFTSHAIIPFKHHL